MTSADSDDPYRGPDVVEIVSTTDARSPTILEWIVILCGVTFTGVLTFLGTCFGSVVSLAAVLVHVSPGVSPAIGMISWPAAFILSVAVSGYVAWRTGRAIHRLFNDVVDETDLQIKRN